jgi:membrane fusion protein, multidrug efflux system
MKTNDAMKWKILFAVLTVSSILACRHTTNETTPKIVRVKVAVISHEKMSFPIRSSGLIVSAKEVKLSFKTGGVIAALYADDGARVKKGELLATLNLSEIEAQVTQVKNGYDKAIRDFNRAKNLYSDSVVTLEQLQNAETAMNVAKANMEIAVFNMNHSKISAPDDGVILKRLVESNEIISPGYPVFIFGTTGKSWKIKAGLSDRDFVRIMPGDSARVFLDAYPGTNFYAVVSQMGESANPRTGTYEIELDMQQTNNRLASGFVANLEIYPSQAETYYRIPIEALVEAEGQSGYVYTVTDSLKTKKIKVDIAGITGSSVAVLGSFGNITEVVTDGVAYLSEGEHVIIVK